MTLQQNKNTQKTQFSRVSHLLVLGTLLTSFGFFAFKLSETAQASFGSFLGGVIGNQQVSAATKAGKVADSQISSSVVLQAPGSPTILAQSTEIPPIEDDSVLSSEIAKMNATITEPVNAQISTYVVRSGDTISGVAKMFNVSVNTILWANDLTSKSSLKAGDTLVILPVTGITYKIRKGDTIQTIANRFKADQNDILTYNDLTLGGTLNVGDEIIIPSGELTAPSVTPSKAPASSVASAAAYFSCPVPGARVSQGIHGHNGVDLAIPVGTPIRAAAGGTVLVSRSNGAWNGAYGNFVVILHPNGTQTLYSHLLRTTVEVGSAVGKGDLVGYVGMTGLTTGPHLHFEVRGGVNPFADPARCRY